jgi:glucose/arabinose dehydrogenase
VALSLERVFPGLPDFSAPLAMLQAPNDPTRWFVVEQGGVVRVFPNLPAVATSSVFIDISDRVAMDGEAGLLGMAFHPDFPGDRRVYLFYSHRDTPNTPPLVSRLSEFTAAIGAATLDPNSERILITLVKNPGTETNHNGGNLAFGPDRLLYAGIGDGGGGNDQHGAFGNAQNPNTLFGKMLRIQPLVARPRNSGSATSVRARSRKWTGSTSAAITAGAASRVRAPTLTLAAAFRDRSYRRSPSTVATWA